MPEYVDVSFTDENVEEINFNEECDIVALSMMLSTQVKRGWEIADEYHKRGKIVIAGGISTMLHAEDMVNHVDSVFLGESEGRMEEVMGQSSDAVLSCDRPNRSPEEVTNQIPHCVGGVT